MPKLPPHAAGPTMPNQSAEPPESARDTTDARLSWQAAFVLLAAIWGCSFWWIKLGLELLAPVQVAFVRLAVGAVALLVLAAALGVPLPRRRSTWRHLLVVGLLFNSIPFTLFAYGETHVSSVLAGIINGATPLATLAVVLVALPEEQPTLARLAGLVVGFTGILIVVGIWNGLGPGELLGIAACVGAVCSYGLAFPYVRRHLSGLPDSGIALAAGQVLCGAALLLPLALVSGGLHGAVAPAPLLGMLGLGVLGSGIAYVLNMQIVREAGATTASTVTYLTPLFAVVVGAAFLGESVSWYEPLGGLIVLFGVALSQGRLRPFATAIATLSERASRGSAERAARLDGE